MVWNGRSAIVWMSGEGSGTGRIISTCYVLRATCYVLVQRATCLRSVSFVLVHHVEQRLAAVEAVEVLSKEIGGGVPVIRPETRRVRRDDDVRQVPEWTCRVEGLVFEDVEARARDGAVPQGLGQRRLVDEFAAADVDEDRVASHRRQLLTTDHLPGRRGLRRGDHDQFGGRQQLQQIGSRMHGRDAWWRRLAAPPADGRHVRPERGEPRGTGGTDA